MTILDAEIEDVGLEEPERPKDQYNAGDRRAVRAREKSAKTAQEQRDDVLKAILSQPNGRAWLAWVMDTVCCLNSPTENGAYDSNALHYREGARAVGLALRAEAIRVNKTAYIKLIEENL